MVPLRVCALSACVDCMHVYVKKGNDFFPCLMCIYYWFDDNCNSCIQSSLVITRWSGSTISDRAVREAR